MAVLMIFTLAIGIWQNLPTKPASAAAPDGFTSQAYLDTNGDGTIDQIDVVINGAEDLTTCTVTADELETDWTYTGNGIGGSIASASCVLATETISFVISGATANTTGATLAPTIAYDNDDLDNSIVNASGNLGAVGAATIADQASPIIVNTYSDDNDHDGDIEHIDIQFSEDILDSTINDPEERDNFEFDDDSTNDGSGEQTVSSGTTAVVYPAVYDVINDEFYDLVVATGIAGTDIAYLHMNTTGLTDASGNLMATGTALGTENDEADPVIMTTSPASAAEDIDLEANIVLTFSEAMTTSSLAANTSPAITLGSATWNNPTNTIATYSSHESFSSLTAYTLTVTAAQSAATGDDGLAAGPVANPFIFTSIAVRLGGGGGSTITAANLNSPNGGESWAGGSSQNITWLATGSGISKIKLSYSLDGGSSYPYIIAENEANDGVYTWTAPNVTSSTAKVKIEALTSTDSVVTSDISNANFTITGVVASFSPTLSTLVASPTSVLANGTATSAVTVTAKDDTGALLSGKTVVLTSSRGTSDTITPTTATTSSTGVATFTVKSSTAGMSTYTATVNGTGLSGTATVSFTNESAPGEVPVSLLVGDLIKSSLSTSVYYYGSDNKRHLFPNEKTYRSWYADWSGIKLIPNSQLQGISLGANVTVRPGTVLLKIETDPKVYAVEPGGLLRWVTTQERARLLYGADWNKQIIDVPLIYWVDYTFGTDIATDTHPTGTLVKYDSSANVYYILGTEKRLFTGAAFEANRYQSKYVESIPETLSYANGIDITGAEAGLVNIY